MCLQGRQLSCLTRPTSVSPECEQLVCCRLLSAASHHFFSPRAALRPSRCPAGACIRVHVVGGRVPVRCLCRSLRARAAWGLPLPDPEYVSLGCPPSPDAGAFPEGCPISHVS